MKKINENELTMVAGGCPRPYVEPVPAPEEKTLPFKPTPVVFDPDAITIV